MMDVDKFYQYQAGLSNEGVFFTFSGAFSYTFMLNLGSMVKNKLLQAHVDQNVVAKIFALVIEQAQNIIFYSAENHTPRTENAEESAVGTIMLGYKDDRFFVLCGNQIATDQVGALRERLEQLQQMDQQQLKLLYKERRGSDEVIEGSKGAGLGLIEMARKSTQVIEFAFNQLDERYSYFALKTVI